MSDSPPLARRLFLRLIAGVATVAVLPERAAVGQQRSPQHRLEVLSEDDALGLLAIVRSLIPLAGTDETVYLAVVAALDDTARRDPGHAKLLKGGLLAARHHFSMNLDQVTVADLERYLRSIQTQAFFVHVYRTTLPVFFGNHSVWERIGYEGESFSKGGYLQRGFNDLDWLPEPPDTVQGPLPF